MWWILLIYLIAVLVIPTLHWRKGLWRRGSDILISFIIGLLVVIMLLIKLVIQIFRWIERV
jgi:glucan phosphoethanolaminetransferase (alkaline phosphatase superfamily)